MRNTVWLLLLLLVLLQQDYLRWWDAPVVVLGFLPRALAIQMAISIATALLWWWITVKHWPALECAAGIEGGPQDVDPKRSVDGKRAS